MTQQSKPNPTSKQWGVRFWIGCFTLLLLSPFLLYYGYCWGLWGRNSLLLQHYFQCKCPPASEQARYPKEVEVIVSACHESWVDLSPSGRLLYVREKDLVLSSNYLLELETMERIDITNQPYSIFLTDELGLVESGLENYIIDRTTGKQYPIERFKYSRPDAQINGNTNIPLLVESLQKANIVYFREDRDILIALAADFPDNLQDNFLVNRFDVPDFRMENFLQENNINYKSIPAGYPEEAISPDGRFIARVDGIYLIGTNQKISEGFLLWARGWTSDGRGVIYSTRYGGRCLLTLSLPMGDDSWCEIEVPQPVIILKVPEEYLSPTLTP